MPPTRQTEQAQHDSTASIDSGTALDHALLSTMDPVCASIGIVTGIASIISVIGKSTSALNTLRVHCKDAEQNLELLIGQLHSVEAALVQVQGFIELLSVDRSQQRFVQQLQDSLHHCGRLVFIVDTQIPRWVPGDTLRIRDKVQRLLDDGTTNGHLTRLSHQIQALNLCLTAFRWQVQDRHLSVHADIFSRTSSEQRSLMRSSESRSIFAQAREDVASLPRSQTTPYASVNENHLPKATSHLSQLKASTSDEVTPLRRKYQDTLRKLLRRTVSAPQPHPANMISSPDASTFTSPAGSRSTSAQSDHVDLIIKTDAQQRRQELHILVLGYNRSALAKQIIADSGDAQSLQEATTYRKLIVSFVFSSLLALLDEATPSLKPLCRYQRTALQEYAHSAAPGWIITTQIQRCALGLWQEEPVQEVFRNTHTDGAVPFFLGSIHRILSPSYIPNMVDIMRFPEDPNGVKETEIKTMSPQVRLIEAPTTKLVKLLHHFEEVDAVIINIDLASYDEYTDEHNSLRLSLRFWTATCRSKSLASKPTGFCLLNMACLKTKLNTSPFSKHFSGYTGQNSAVDVGRFVLEICKRAVSSWRSDRILFHHFIPGDSHDSASASSIRDTIKALPLVVWAMGFESNRRSLHAGGWRKCSMSQTV